MGKTVFKVDGMSCSHCENSIKKAVSALDGVTGVDVSLSEKTVTVEHGSIPTVDAISNEIEELGYDVVG